jgi:nucleoside phosphorylase
VLVCFAVREEARFFSAADVGGRNVQVLLTGIGRQNALSVVEEVIKGAEPELVLSCGFAGALNSALQVGDVVYSNDAGDPLEQRLVAAGGVRASFHCAARIAIVAAEKAALRASTRADAVEMESEWIRQVCRERRIRSATVRAISDSAQEDLPLDFNKVMTPDMRLSLRKLASAVFLSPGRIGGLLRLQRQTRLAAQRLGSTLRRVLV